MRKASTTRNSTSPAVAEATPRQSVSPSAAERRIALLGVILTAIAFAYFQGAGHHYFSTQRMSPIFRYLLTVDDPKTAWLTFGACILAALWKNPAPLVRVVDSVGSNVNTVVLASVALFGLGALFIYQNNAFCMDEYAAVFQAKTFATGRLTAQLPPSVVDWIIPPGFNGAFLIASRTTGQAIEAYWPGFALLLAPFEFLGAPWLCNASLAGFAIFLVHRITFEITEDRRAAGWAVLFTVASGVFAAYAISYYSMQAHLTANLLFVWLLLKPTPCRAFGAGIVGSLALVLHNPFPHVLFAAPWIVAIARSREQRRSLVALILGYLPLTMFIGAGWLYLRGFIGPRNSGFNVISHNIVYFRFPDKSMIDMRIAAIFKMWIWAVPCLFLFAALGRVRRRDDPHVRLLAQSAAVTFVGYLCFIFDQGHGWGYRYFQSAWGVVPILAACAMTTRPESNGRLAAFAGAAAILNLVLVVPVQMMQIHDIIARHSAQLPNPRRPGNNAYFVHASGGFYLGDLVQSDPLLRDDDLILFSRGPELDAELRRQNWPTAVLVERRFGVEEWNLGPKDQRQPSTDTPGVERFAFAYSDRAM
jgi:hypothetical protein